MFYTVQYNSFLVIGKNKIKGSLQNFFFFINIQSDIYNTALPVMDYS